MTVFRNISKFCGTWSEIDNNLKGSKISQKKHPGFSDVYASQSKVNDMEFDTLMKIPLQITPEFQKIWKSF